MPSLSPKPTRYTTHLSSPVVEADADSGIVVSRQSGDERRHHFDHLTFATDLLTAARLHGDSRRVDAVSQQALPGSSGKLNLMFRQPVRWKHGTGAAHSDAAFRFIFGVSSLDDFQAATLGVMNEQVAYMPGFMQIYCEGSAMRQLKSNESVDRLAVFFKNLSLNLPGSELAQAEQQVKKTVLDQIESPEDCIWSRLLTPGDLQQLFHFPGGNIDHTVLTGGQTYFDRNYSVDPETDFYRFGDRKNVWICGAGTYPCGSAAGTPGYMCSQQLLGKLRLSGMPLT